MSLLRSEDCDLISSPNAKKASLSAHQAAEPQASGFAEDEGEAVKQEVL